MSTHTLPGSFPAQETAFPGPYRKPSDLPDGDWLVMANGRIFTLTIEEVAGSRVEATFSSGDFERGTWEPGSRKLTFLRVLPRGTQEFTGYLFHFDDADTKWRLGGTFGDVEGGPESGWYATQPRS